tara:strand:+ start:187 stop:873 length:687 start_codon:yes stop_codon:yes gene_type:complete
MQLISYFEFLDLFPEGKKVILVGNSPSLRGEALGKWIDSHDVVIRFNHCPMQGYSEDVGTRTDILVTNPYPENRPSIQAKYLPKVILVMSPQTRRGNLASLKAWAQNRPTVFTYTPALMGLKDSDHSAALTTGSYASHLIPRILKPSGLSITGFTLFLTGEGHYWNQSLPKGIHAHDVERETVIFSKILQNCKCPLTVTEEINWLTKQANTPLSKSTNMIPLKSQKWN